MTCKKCEFEEENQQRIESVHQYLEKRNAAVAKALLPILEIGGIVTVIRFPDGIEINGKIFQEEINER